MTSATISSDMTGTSEELFPYIHLLRCPFCKADLKTEEGRLSCRGCLQSYPLEEGIPLLFAPSDAAGMPDDITQVVQEFYEEHPFPDYEDSDDLGRFIDKARRGVFADLLDRQIPPAARVLECGCGTGQLSNFLGIARRAVFGTDICLNSLKLAQRFRESNGIRHAYFLQMNLFRPVFEPASFDFVISNGVIHSTWNPYLGFQTLAGMVKPGGYLIVGLYHRFGRLLTDLRRWIFRITENRFTFLDPRLRNGQLGQRRWKAWFADQYQHPHELKYTIAEVANWLEPNGLELVKSIPKTRFSAEFSAQEDLFSPEPQGGPLERRLIEISMALKDDKEGGFFTIIARKKHEA